ncbi:hypothetical protein OG432_15980 [Streptomyces sp. NBC_00442]|uniref:competence protein CoiA family protein n=1 Tax=Streptomyces sp. NBC_00442 TaxID=2903651 RepID=UPI002E1E34E0
MANGIWHAEYGIAINLTRSDLGLNEYQGCLPADLTPEKLLEDITRPLQDRERERLQCLDHHEHGVCKAEREGRSPWMTVRRCRRGTELLLIAAHLPARSAPTPPESLRHQALKERIVRAAERHSCLTADAEMTAQGSRRKIRSDVRVSGPGRTVGWEAQYSPITAPTVRRRSQIAVEAGITPLWVTDSDRAALINRAPWARVDDVPWQDIASRARMLIRGGVRYLQEWKCTAGAERQCPAKTASMFGCGDFHTIFEVPALCLPAKRHTEVDELVVASADGSFVPLQVPMPSDPRQASRMWVPAQDHERWLSIVGHEPTPLCEEDPPDSELTFHEEELDAKCRFGEESSVRNDPRPIRERGDDRGLRTFTQLPPRIPRQAPGRSISDAERQERAEQYGCRVWEIGACPGCGQPMHRYGRGAAHACRACRSRFVTR